jgi:signal transduction histidine kinase
MDESDGGVRLVTDVTTVDQSTVAAADREAPPSRWEEWPQVSPATGGGLLAVFGVVVGGLNLTHLPFAHGSGELLLEVLVPTGFALGVVYAGVQTARGRVVEGRNVARLVGWSGLGAAAMLLVGVWVGLHSDVATPVVHLVGVTANTVALGALGGVVVGVYDARGHHREQVLQRLHTATRDLMKAEGREDVATRAVAVTRGVLGLPINGVWLYDDEAEALVPVAQTEEGQELFGEPPTFYEGESLSWETFRDGRVRVYDDVSEVPGRYNDSTPVRSELVLPLGDHGVMNIGDTEPDRFDRTTVTLARLLAANTEVALDRAARERDLRHQQRELRRQRDRLDQFAGLVSHDLRNPLTVATGHLAEARTAREAGEDDEDHLAAVSRALDRMEQMTGDLLRLARDGGTVEETEPVDLERLVSECWAGVQTGTAASVVVEDSGTIRADASRLRHLLENLFGNAVEHGASGSRPKAGDAAGDGDPDVEVRVGILPDCDGFFVADDGPGIPADDREAVFEAGYSSRHGGNGLGLAIVAEVAEAHGWTVDVTDSETGGARFEVRGVDVVDRDG